MVMRGLTAAVAVGLIFSVGGCADKKKTTDAKKPAVAKKKHVYITPDMRPLSFMDMMGMLPDATGKPAARASALSACKGMASRGAHAPFKRDDAELWGDKEAWRNTCGALSALPENGDMAAFYNEHFCAYTVEPEKDGLFTGYYLPQINISAEKTDTFKHPVYGKPSGHTSKKRFASRRDIEKNGLDNASVIAWADDAVALFFLHIQGSGYGVYPDGKRVTLAFAGKNNHPYTSIGKVMIDKGAMTKEEMSGRSLKAKLYEDTGVAEDVMRQNDSYVFFRLQQGATVKGAAGVPLEAEHAIAVDPSFLPYYTPMLLVTEISKDGAKKEPFVRFVHSLDTGSAIKGAKRADIFFGGGTDAESYAYHQQYKGELIVFLPRDGRASCPRPKEKSILNIFKK